MGNWDIRSTSVVCYDDSKDIANRFSHDAEMSICTSKVPSNGSYANTGGFVGTLCWILWRSSYYSPPAQRSLNAIVTQASTLEFAGGSSEALGFCRV